MNERQVLDNAYRLIGVPRATDPSWTVGQMLEKMEEIGLTEDMIIETMLALEEMRDKRNQG